MHQVEVVQEEYRFLIGCLYREIVVVFLFVPTLIADELCFDNIAKFEDVVGRDGELVDSMVGHKNSFYRVDVDVSLVAA